MTQGHRTTIAMRIADALDAGLVPWATAYAGVIPGNPLTGRIFRGGNAFALMSTGFADPRWCTLEQAEQSGWKVNRGATSTVVEFWRYAQTSQQRNDAGKVETVRVPLAHPTVRYVHLFNAAQVTGMPAPSADTSMREQTAEQLLASSAVTIIHQRGAQERYDVARDSVYLPPESSYPTREQYLAAAVHQLAAAMDHPARAHLSRRENDDERALIHELGGVLIGGRLGLRGEPSAATRHWAPQWATLLRRDSNALFRAAREAERLVEYALARSQDLSGSRADAPIMSRTQGFPTSETEKRMTVGAHTHRLPLFVPFHEKDEAKALGAKWDSAREMWYVPPGVEPKRLGKWLEPPKALSESDIIGQFADACREAGLVLDGPPIMDGKWHRTGVDEAKNPKAKQGAYIGNLGGGKPNGYIENKLTGYATPWSVKGAVLTDAERDKQEAIAREGRERQAKELVAKQERAAQISKRTWDRLKDADSVHPYLVRKQLTGIGARIDGEALVVPLRDVGGKIWSLQRIFADQDRGKLYVADGRKTGCFHTLGEMGSEGPVLFAEGYATGASLHLATALPVVLVFDSGNFASVLEALKPTLGDRRLLMCGDDDALSMDRVMKRLSGMLANDRTFKKLELRALDADELVLDGQMRPARHNPACAVSLKQELGPEGVMRIVAQIANSDTGGQLRVLLNNVGREKAIAAANAAGGEAIFPKFVSQDGAPTDFNDLHVREGLAEVRRQIGAVVRLEREDRPSPSREAVYTAEAGGRYLGKITAIDVEHVTQQIAPGVSVTHARANMPVPPTLGANVVISYFGGKASISRPVDEQRLEAVVQR